jgi:uroporphyrinogen-III synthase
MRYSAAMNRHFNLNNLNNLRVLNTRPVHLAKATSDKITEAGGIPIELPLITIKATPSDWIQTCPALSTMQHMIFISPNAVHYFFKTSPSHPWPRHLKYYALGTGTQAALQKQNRLNAILPTHPDSEHLLMLDDLQTIQDQNILLIKGTGGRKLIENTLTRRGAHIIPIEVYQRALPTPNPANLESLWHEDAVDIILITSETALQHLFALFNQAAHAWLRTKPCLVISERLANIAHNAGFKETMTTRTF